MDARLTDIATEQRDYRSVVQAAYNAVDPLHCYCGNNYDEYLGYAERFVECLPSALVAASDQLSPELVEELVRRTFGPAQIVLGFVELEDIKAVANEILKRLS